MAKEHDGPVGVESASAHVLTLMDADVKAEVAENRRRFKVTEAQSLKMVEQRQSRDEELRIAKLQEWAIWHARHPEYEVNRVQRKHRRRYPLPPPPPSRALQYAEMAIRDIDRIDPSDPDRAKAFAVLRERINREP